MVLRKKSKLVREVRDGKVIYTFSTDAVNDSGPAPTLSLAQGEGSVSGTSSQMVTLLVHAAAIGVALGCGWFGYEALINPDVSIWINQFFPTVNPSRSGTTTAQTPEQIQHSLQSQGYTPGDRLILSTQPDLLLPLLTHPPECQDCPQQISELQVYRALQIPPLLQLFQTQRHFRLLEQQSVVGLSTEDLIAPELMTRPNRATSLRLLPLTQIQPYLVSPSTGGTWLHLSGVQTHDSGKIAYGQILYFDPQRPRLQRLLSWQSSTGEIPQWQQRDQAPAELVVDQSLGLEPHFDIYQLAPGLNHSFQLQLLSLDRPAFANADFEQSLQLARSGLWSATLLLLSHVKQQHPQYWSTLAQSQLEAIRLHAQVTQKQAEQPALNPSDRLIALLINGSWQAALAFYQASPGDRAAMQTVLERKGGGLMQRVEAALSLNPDQTEIIAEPAEATITWGVLILTAQQGQGEAATWLSKRVAKNSPSYTRIQDLARSLISATVDGSASD